MQATRATFGLKRTDGTTVKIAPVESNWEEISATEAAYIERRKAAMRAATVAGWRTLAR